MRDSLALNRTYERLTVSRLLTDKADLGRTELFEAGRPAAIADGEALLRIDRFALTTNNITYAAFGDAMNYWDFFPTGEAGWGHMPIWGFADIVASSVPGAEPGERFYGYFPIASHVVLRPERVSERGFYDGAAHRRGLTSAYNQYTRCSTDPIYAPEREGLQALCRPLFITSFMLADFLADNDFFGARRLVVSSASSKTAYGTVFCLGDDARVSVTGLTSARNADFVRGLGRYAAAAPYDALETLAADVPTAYVDFFGDVRLRARMHDHFGPSLVYDCFVGSTANTDFLADAGLPGPAPKFYFAPVQIKKRNADWGPAELTRRMNAAQLGFFDHLMRADPPWLRVVEGTGFADAGAVIRSLATDGGDPAIGNVVRLG